MPKYDMKALKVLAILISAVVIIILTVYIHFTSTPKEKEEELVDSLNNGETVIQHKDYIYCSTKMMQNGKTTNVLLKVPVDSDTNNSKEIITTFSNSLENIKLWFFENKLFYDDSKVYIYDLEKKKADMFCEGELQFMLEPNGFVMLQDGNLYKLTYYPSTYMAKDIEYIAVGDFIRAGEDDDKVYYYSTSGTSNTIIVALDKESLRMMTLDNINTRKQSVKAVVTTDDYVYAFISEDNGTQYIKQISKKLNKDETADTKKILIDNFDTLEVIDTKYTRPLNLNNTKKNKKETFNDVYFYTKVIISEAAKYEIGAVYDTKLYKYDSKTNKVEEYNGSFNELYVGGYSAVADGSRAVLYNGDKKITEIETGFSNLGDITVNTINIIQTNGKNYLYYEILVNDINEEDGTLRNSDVILAVTMLEGGTSRRIN